MAFIYALFTSFIIASAVIWKHKNHPSKDSFVDIYIAYCAGVLAMQVSNSFN